MERKIIGVVWCGRGYTVSDAFLCVMGGRYGIVSWNFFWGGWYVYLNLGVNHVFRRVLSSPEMDGGFFSGDDG